MHIELSQNQAAAYLSSVKIGGRLHRALSDLGAFKEAKMTDNLILPLSKDVATQLRHILTGENVTLADGVGPILARIADTNIKPTQDKLLQSSDGKILIDAQLHPIQDYSVLMHAITQATELAPVTDGVFRIEPEKLESFMASLPSGLQRSFAGSSLYTPVVKSKNRDPFATNQPALPGLESVEEPVRHIISEKNLYDQDKIVKELNTWEAYDGTLDSLRNVKLSDYDIIAKDSAKVKEQNAKKAAGNKKAKTVRSMAQKLAAMGLTNAYELLHHFPHRHIDRSTPRTMSSMSIGEEGSIIAYVQGTKSEYGRTRYCRVLLQDSGNYRFDVTLWQQPYMEKYYKKGDQVIVSGIVGQFRGKRQMERPSIDKIGSDRSAMSMIPVYYQSDTQKITTYDIMALVQETLGHMRSKGLVDPVSAELLEEHHFINRWDAYFNIHFPENRELYEAAYQRLVYDEFLRLQMFIQSTKKDQDSLKGLSQCAPGTLVDSWLESLPYEPTKAQSRAMENVGRVMESDKPLHTLVQGDVGAGKSTIANFVMLKTLENGFQGAVLAPTDILAEQLYEGFLEASKGLTSPRTGLPIDVRFLGKRNKGLKQERINKEDLQNGVVDVMIGTHALVFESTKFANLGAVVLDEQHRFGVEQRSHLRQFGREDGITPDTLLMTATPIPRSSAQVLYGDLDIEILDELPPGRKKIETRWERTNTDDALRNPRLQPWNEIREAVNAGHQAYVVATLVEDNEKMQEKSVIETYETMRDYLFPTMRIGYMHGRMKKADRDEVMGAFKNGDLDILVATTVIEVGVNVPNSTIIAILDPGRFGIAQLHQLRGRVGRSSFQSYCWLVGEVSTSKGESTMEAIVESTDGFYLAEKDLQIRGEGKLFSTSQSGDSDFKLASVTKNADVLDIAVKDAAVILSEDRKSYDLLMDETDHLFGDKVISS